MKKNLKKICINQDNQKISILKSTGQPRYVKLAYLEYTAYVEVIIHSQIFPLYCIVIRPCLCQTRLS